ncbi:MAG: polysaccharide biosynthesis tyrosine autokinase [Planctomyces sp.]|nr:polysaccharide biosynthesis tyrosine autokinase [Planctomyces sp.]
MKQGAAGSSAGDVEFAPLGIGRPASERSIDLARFAIALWKPMAVGLAGGVVLGVLAYLWLGPVYDASTQIKVSKKASLPMNDGEARHYGDRGEHVYLIKSDAICRRALIDFGLQELPAFQKAYDPVKDISESLTVKRTAGQDSSFDNLIDLSYLHPDKAVARQVVEAVVQAYKAYLDDTRDVNSQELAHTLTTQLAQVEREIVSIEDDYHGWRNGTLFLPTPVIVSAAGVPVPGQSPYVVELEKINAAIRDNMLKRTAIEAKRKTLSDMLAREESRSAIQVWVLWSLSTGTASSSGGEGGGGGGGGGGGAILASPPGKAELDTQLLSARLLEHRLLHVLGPHHNDVVNVRRQVNAILEMYRQNGFAPPVLSNLGDAPGPDAGGSVDLASIYAKVLDDQLNELASNAELLATQQEESMKRAMTGMALEKKDQDWKERIADKKKFRDDLQSKLASYVQTRDQEGYRLEQIAQVRVEKSMKRLMKIVGTFSMLGLFCVFGLAYFREWYDTSLRTLDEVRSLTDSQLLASVPEIRTSAELERMASRSRLHPRLCYAHRPGSREAEAYRTMRTALMHAAQDLQAKVILVSSPEPGDGKTTTICNLALALAQSGRKVLLVDADLRRPTVHEMFRVSQEAGLSEVLLGELDWQNALKATPLSNLSVMSAGMIPENPAELLSTPGLGAFLKSAREEFDCVLVDAPPVLAVSDPCIIAPSTDGLVLVVRLRKNSRAAVERTRDTLDAYGVRRFGVIANGTGRSEDDGIDYDSYESYYSSSPSAIERATVGVG